MNRIFIKNKILVNNLYNIYKHNNYIIYNLADCILSKNEKNKIKNSFNYLAIDSNNDDLLKKQNNINIIPPTRLRKFANFDVSIDNNMAYLNLNSKKLRFKQDVDDFRSKERVFELLDFDVLESNFLGNLISQSCFLVNKINKNKNKYNVSIHQVRQIAYPDLKSENSPEGIHRDGTDFIISALVMNRYNVIGGESIIYDENKKDIKLYKKLKENNAIFQEDRKLWHYVNPINCENSKYLGIRDIFGLDIKYL